jgi:hypothetical protein
MKFERTCGAVYFSLLYWLLVSSCSERENGSLQPHDLETGSILTIEKGNLKAIFVDNAAISPDHRAGYNGIAQLYYDHQHSGVFVPAYAGFNLEHIFGGDSLQQLFEPRQHPMTLYRKSDDEVLLYQERTPLSSVESLTTFKVVPPHYIDVSFQCIFHDQVFFKHGYAGLFWASYINHPDDRKIYFRGITKSRTDDERLIEGWSDEHGVASTHKAREDVRDFYFAENFNATLASNFSENLYTEPYFFGRYGSMVVAYLFDAKEVIRFSQSPTGGGDLNPAWDFQYLVPSPTIGKKYGFKARLIFKPFVSDEDVHDEYTNWMKK